MKKLKQKPGNGLGLIIYGSCTAIGKLFGAAVFLVLAGCGVEDNEPAGHVREQQSANEITLEALLTDRVVNQNLLLSTLAGLRYRDTIDEQTLVLLRNAWEDGQEGEGGNENAQIKRVAVRLILAELLYRYDKARPAYKSYLVASLNSPRPDVRAQAALGVGMIGARDQVDALHEMATQDSKLPAIQAVLGLIAMDTPLAYSVLDEIAMHLSKRGDREAKEILETLNIHMEHMRQE